MRRPEDGSDSTMTSSDRSFEGRRVGFAGPMLGSHPGWVTSQHEILAERIAADGAAVLCTSARIGRVGRLIDTAVSLVRWRGRVDVVVIAVFSGPGFWMADLTSRIARWCGFRQVLVLHGGNLPDYGRRHPRHVARLFRRADAVVAPSRYLADEMPDGSAVTVIPNVFDLDAIPWKERAASAPRLLWMRTFHPIYNPMLALDVFSRVTEQHPDAVLTMAGQDKGLRDACVERARQLGLGGSVTFPGYLDEYQKHQALVDHDVFLNTNDVDNMPVSVLEAAAAGLPVVATRVGGLPYLFHDGEDALLVPPGDAEAMAAAVGRVLDDSDLSRRLSVGGRAVAESSSWTTVGTLWRDLFDGLPAGRSDRAPGVSSPPGSGSEDDRDGRAERDRIQAVYGGYTTSGREADRWDDEAPGNRCILAERRHLMERTVATRSTSRRVLEIGCGRGTVLGDLAEVLAPDASLCGVDLLRDRLIDAHRNGHAVAQADGRHLPFADDRFDLVVTFTVFSSIPDPSIRRNLADEIRRVLRPGGAVLWYDMRLPSPNRAVRPLGRLGVAELFPGMAVRLESTTVLPPLARRLGDRDRRLYPLLRTLPPLRSHLFGVIG